MNLNDENIRKTIAKRLRKIRIDKLLSQQNVVDDINSKGGSIAISSLRNYENGYKTPNICILISLAKYYDVSLDYLVDDNITTSNKENVNICKELKLDDKSINTIKEINNKGLNNQFIETINSKYFMTILHNSENYNTLIKFRNEFMLIHDNALKNNKIDYNSLKTLIEKVVKYKFVETEENDSSCFIYDTYKVNVINRCNNTMKIINNNSKVDYDKVLMLLKELYNHIGGICWSIENETRLLYRYENKEEL